MSAYALCLAAAVTLGNARFTPLTDRMVRCEWSADGTFEDRPSLTFVNREMPEVPFDWARRPDGGVCLKTARLTLEWTGGAFNETNLVVNGVAVLTKDEENLLGTKRTLDGERSLASVLPNMKLEGGLFSRRGVTVVDDTKTPLFVETDSHWRKWVEERPPRAEGSYRDLTVFAYGNDYKGGLGDYIKVAGRIPLPPRWAFGYWWSRYWLYTDTEIRELVDQMKSVDIPIDVFVIDMEWHDTWRIGDRPDLKDEFGQYWGWTGYTWNKRLFPNHKSTLKYLHDNGCKTALNLHPASGIQPVEACYDAFAKDYGWQGTNAVPYHGDEEKWATCYFKNVLAPMEAEGVDFWWLDWQQWRMSKDKPTLSNTFWLNHLFAAHSAERDGGTKRPFIYHRWGGLGSHRYQVGFSGDSKVAWSMLEVIPWFTATASNVGYGYWGHDIAGHMDPVDGSGLDGELFTRWLQSGVFTPIFKTHCAKDPRIERRIWKFPDHFFILREAIRLRYRLAPYIYTAAREAYDTGVSMCRPLYYDWPAEEAAYNVTNAYLFGDSILAATISKPMDKAKGVSEIDIWFPEGKWYDVSTGDLIDGGGVIRREYRIEDNPWFVKAGAIIPMYPDSVKNLAAPGTDDLVLFVAPGADVGECEIYEDDGDNPDYATNFRKTQVVREGARVTIAPRKGAYTLKFPLLAAPLSVKVNGAEIPWEYDAADLAVVVQTPPQDGVRKTVVELALPPDAQETSARLCGLKGEFARVDTLTEEFKSLLMPIHFAMNLPDSWQAYWQARAAIAADPANLAKHLADRDRAREAVLADIDRLSPKLPPDFVRRVRSFLNDTRFAWRGILLDEARHFFGKEAVKRILDGMAARHYSVFHWHLVDNQGWRIEIKRYPELTAVASMRNTDEWRRIRTEGWADPDVPFYGPYFYTQDDMREIVAYAAERGIAVVPEIEIPGHCRALLKARPSLQCANVAARLDETETGYRNAVVCVGSDETLKFYEGVLDEVCALFPSPVVHLGGDEVKTEFWQHCPRCQRRLRAEGLADEVALKGWLMRRLESYLAAKGRRVGVWDESLEDALSTNAVIFCWRGGDVARRAAEKGYDVVLCPEEYCYFDFPQGLADDPHAYHPRGGRAFQPLTVEKVRSFDPLAGIPAACRNRILGAQANNWTELTLDEPTLAWKLWPRATALAEVLLTKGGVSR